jgi:hypothetical protein
MTSARGASALAGLALPVVGFGFARLVPAFVLAARRLVVLPAGRAVGFAADFGDLAGITATFHTYRSFGELLVPDGFIFRLELRALREHV